jgi:hypothetical protein
MKNRKLYNLVILYGAILWITNIVMMIMINDIWWRSIGGIIAIIFPPSCLLSPFVLWYAIGELNIPLFIFWLFGLVLVFFHAYTNYGFLRKT